jgi:hypothetical protein
MAHSATHLERDRKTMNLTQLQQDAREEFEKEFFPIKWSNDTAFDAAFLKILSKQKEFLDRLTARVYAAALDSVESGMPEQELLPLHCSDTTFAFGRGRNDMRTQLLSHLRTLREGITGNEHAK